MNASEGERLDRIRLARAEGIGPITFSRLLARFGTAAAAIEALPEMARAVGRAGNPTPLSREAAEAEIGAAAAIGGHLLVLGDAAYPYLLTQIADPPPVLAVLGDPAHLSARPVAIVGSRNASANGRKIAEMLGECLAASGCAVVSGLARGIDAAAHLGALRAGATVACVAGGLDRPYPPEHAGLQARIAERGAVVSEWPLGTEPAARNFPRRNRVIAGLARGIVVVEAALRSGSLITARLALEGNREVFAVPGSPLDPRCSGSNGLLRDGAHLVETAADVLANLPSDTALPLRLAALRTIASAASSFAPTSLLASALPVARAPASVAAPEPPGVHAEIVELLGADPVSVDDVIRRCQFSPAVVVSALLDLELGGRVEALPGNRVALLGPA